MKHLSEVFFAIIATAILFLSNPENRIIFVPSLGDTSYVFRLSNDGLKMYGIFLLDEENDFISPGEERINFFNPTSLVEFTRKSKANLNKKIALKEKFAKIVEDYKDLLIPLWLMPWILFLLAIFVIETNNIEPKRSMGAVLVLICVLLAIFHPPLVFLTDTGTFVLGIASFVYIFNFWMSKKLNNPTPKKKRLVLVFCCLTGLFLTIFSNETSARLQNTIHNYEKYLCFVFLASWMIVKIISRFLKKVA